MKRRKLPIVQYGVVEAHPSVPSPAFAEVKVEVAAGEDWCAYGHFVETSRGPMLIEVRLFPLEDRGEGIEIGEWSGDYATVDRLSSGITARLLRTISVSEIEHHMRLRLAKASPRHDSFRLAVKESMKLTRVGRRGQTDAYYARWAARYARKIEQGDPSPVASLAAETDHRHSQVRDLIHKARERGLLSPGVKGRPGGRLTDKGITALRRKET